MLFLAFYFILYFLFSTFFKFLFLLCYLCLSLSFFVSLFFSSLPLLDVRSLLVFLFIFTSFIRSISVCYFFFSYVLSGMCAFASTQRRPKQRDAFRSRYRREKILHESVYLGKRLRLPHCIEELPFSFTPCQVLRQCAGVNGRCRFKGVLRFIADDTKVTLSQNIFTLL